MGSAAAVNTAVSASLYERLGGAAVVAAVVDDVVDRHAANPALAGLFQGQDLPQLKAQAVTFLSASAGGPREALTADPKPWPAELRFSPHQWQAVAGDVDAALREQGIGATEVDEVVRLFCEAGQGHPGCSVVMGRHLPGTNQERGPFSLHICGSDGGSVQPKE